jgi:hypothetical protein
MASNSRLSVGAGATAGVLTGVQAPARVPINTHFSLPTQLVPSTGSGQVPFLTPDLGMGPVFVRGELSGPGICPETQAGTPAR